MDLQALKAGILELADIAVVNMADRPGAEESARQLRSMLDSRVTVQTTVAADGRGVAELAATLDATWAALQTSGGLAVRRQTQARHQLHMTASAFLDECIAGMTVDGPLQASVGALLEEAARRWRT